MVGSNTVTKEDLFYSKEAHKVSRFMKTISQHMADNGTTLKDEYDLIQQKKSTLGRNYRDFIVEHFFNEEPTNDGSEDIKNLVK